MTLLLLSITPLTIFWPCPEAFYFISTICCIFGNLWGCSLWEWLVWLGACFLVFSRGIVFGFRICSPWEWGVGCWWLRGWSGWFLVVISVGLFLHLFIEVVPGHSEGLLYFFCQHRQPLFGICWKYPRLFSAYLEVTEPTWSIVNFYRSRIALYVPKLTLLDSY